MADQGRDEKELRKREEKSAEEKEWEEKYRRDPLGAVVWPLILIWAGIVFLAWNLGLLRFLAGAESAFGFGVWSLVFLGAGGIILIEVLLRLLLPEYRRPITGSLIIAIIFIGIGLGQLVSWNIVWPIILIIIGLGILTRRTWTGRR